MTRIRPELPTGQVLVGDCRELLKSLPDGAVDAVFADPPYNLQLRQELRRPNRSLVDGVDDAWDQFPDLTAYDAFSREWLAECRRILKPGGTIWVMGSYHNIFRLGSILQDLGYWILNDIIWIKSNPMPNFRGVRFTNAHETLIWAVRARGETYTFNHQAMRALNEDLQMRSDWYLPLCNGKERLRRNGVKLHATQKPEALLYRVLTACTLPGQVVLDPFFGTGTTGAVAEKLGRRWLGIEQDPDYARAALERIRAVQPADPQTLAPDTPRRLPRIPFGALLENNLLSPGQRLYFRSDQSLSAVIQADGCLEYNDQRGSIHAVARLLSADGLANGWQLWLYEAVPGGPRQPIDRLRQRLRKYLQTEEKS